MGCDGTNVTAAAQQPQTLHTASQLWKDGVNCEALLRKLTAYSSACPWVSSVASMEPLGVFDCALLADIVLTLTAVCSLHTSLLLCRSLSLLQPTRLARK